MEQEKHSQNQSAFWQALIPALVFTVLVMLIQSVLLLFLEKYQTGAGDAAFSFVNSHRQTIYALIGALADLAAFLPFVRAAKDESSMFQKEKETPAVSDAFHALFSHVPGRESGAALLLFLSAVFLCVGINILISLSLPASLSGGAEGMTDFGAGDAAYPLVSLLVYGVFTPAVEEYVFRGITFLRLRRVFAKREEKQEGKSLFSQLLSYSGTIPAMLISAALFALYHGNLAQGIYAFVMGCLFAFATELSGRVRTGILLHMAANICVLLLSILGLYNNLCTPVWCACFLLPGLLFPAVLVHSLSFRNGLG